MLPEGSRININSPTALDDWIRARGSTVADQKNMIMTIGCEGGLAASYLALGVAAVVGLAAQL